MTTTVEPNPAHQDPAVPVPRVQVATVLALLRVVAGPRGWAGVSWWAGGFTYSVQVARQPRTSYLVDHDPDAAPTRGALTRLWAYLHDNTPER